MKKILMTAGFVVSIVSSYAQAGSFFDEPAEAPPIQDISIKCKNDDGGALLISEKNNDIRQANSFEDLVGLKLSDVVISNKDGDVAKHLISFTAKLLDTNVTGETSIVTKADRSEQLVLNYLDQTINCEIVK